MTYVVTETCIKCKYTDCVDVCPVDCFREGPNFLVIDPDECIDCTLCVAECPVEAIFAEDDVPDNQKEFTALNAELAKVWKPIIEKKDGPPDADEWAKDQREETPARKNNEARDINPRPGRAPGSHPDASVGTPAQPSTRPRFRMGESQREETPAREIMLGT